MNVGKLPDELQSMRVDILTCRKCGGFKECTKPVPFYGNSYSPIVFVARNPGEQEDQHGQPLYPKDRSQNKNLKPNAGNVFRQILWHLGLSREEVYITNTMKCYTTVPAKNRAPTEAECRICSNLYLCRELEIVNPQLVVTLGKEALATLLNVSFAGCHISQWAKECKVITASGVPIYPMFHPASVLYPDSDKEAFVKNVMGLKQVWHENKKEIYERTWREKICGAIL